MRLIILGALLLSQLTIFYGTPAPSLFLVVYICIKKGNENQMI